MSLLLLNNEGNEKKYSDGRWYCYVWFFGVGVPLGGPKKQVQPHFLSQPYSYSISTLIHNLPDVTTAHFTHRDNLSQFGFFTNEFGVGDFSGLHFHVFLLLPIKCALLFK